MGPVFRTSADRDGEKVVALVLIRAKSYIPILFFPDLLSHTNGCLGVLSVSCCFILILRKTITATRLLIPRSFSTLGNLITGYTHLSPIRVAYCFHIIAFCPELNLVVGHWAQKNSSSSYTPITSHTTSPSPAQPHPSSTSAYSRIAILG